MKQSFVQKHSTYQTFMINLLQRKLHIILLLFILIAGNSLSAQEEAKSYESVIKSANTKFEEKDYVSAKTYYEMALRFKAEDAFAKKRLTETVDLLKKQMEQQEVFYRFLDQADQLLAENKSEEALASFKEALKIFPKDKYALGKALKIEETLETERKKTEAYNSAFTLGSKLLEEKKYEEAQFQLNQAVEIFSGRKEAVDLLTLTNQNLLAEQQKRDNFNKLRQEAEQFISRKDYKSAVEKLSKANELIPEDSKNRIQLVETQKLLEKSTRYNEVLAMADDFYAQKMLPEARQKYTEAQEVWSEQAYPADMIKRINETLQSEAFLKLEAFNKSVTAANQLFTEKKFAEAKTAYTEALALKPGDDFVQKRILETEAIIESIAKQQETDASFAAIMTKAATQLSEKQYENALTSYREASVLKPAEKEPMDKITELENLIARNKAAADLENQYNNLIAQADGFLIANEFVRAKEAYSQASALKPVEAYPKSKIAEAEKKMMEQELTAGINKKYNDYLSTADLAFASQKWSEAKIAYTEALNVKTNEKYPQDQLAIVNETISRIEKESANQKAYDEALAMADKLAGEQKYDEAILSYQTALGFKPGEAYPQDQITSLNDKIKQLADARERQSKVESLKSQAEDAFNRKEYDASLGLLNQIVGLDNTNTYAPAKIAEIKLMQESLNRENQRLYDENIALGNANLDKKAYTDAIVNFKNALGNKPADAYANEKLTQIDNILKEKLLAQKSEYNKFITEADRQFNTKIYDKAVEGYLLAENAKPDETYPREMIRKIADIIEKNKLFVLNNEADKIILKANQPKRFDFKPVDVAERRGNIILLKARNTGNRSFPLLISFGSKDGKNGSFVLPMPEKDDFNDFIVRIGSQYKWFSEDNTWIEIYPENGDVEISLIQISRGN